MQVAVEAHPNARTERVELAADDSLLRIWVRAPAVDGRANTAIERALATALGLRPHQVCLVRGATSHHKTFEVDLADLDELRAQLSHGRSRSR